MLTQKELKRRLLYDRFTGVLYWKKEGNIRAVGKVAGSQDAGYTRIMIENKSYLAHRLAWLYEYGYFPDGLIDHIDKNRGNNTISNLRLATKQGNSRNRTLHKRSTTGINGVTYEEERSSWKVTIASAQLGRFKSFTEAVATRYAAEQCLDWQLSDDNTTAKQYMEKYLKSIKE